MKLCFLSNKNTWYIEFRNSKTNLTKSLLKIENIHVPRNVTFTAEITAEMHF